MSDNTDKTLRRVMKAYVDASPAAPDLGTEDRLAMHRRPLLRHPVVVAVVSFAAVLLLVGIAGLTLGSTDGAPADVTTVPTVTLADGRVYLATDCPAAQNLLIGGYESADALPMKGQTDRARVESMLSDIRERFVGSTDVVAVHAIPRNGEVWYRLDDGDYAVELVEDFQYEFILSPDGSCPRSPYNINGVPVLYNRAEVADEVETTTSVTHLSEALFVADGSDGGCGIENMSDGWQDQAVQIGPLWLWHVAPPGKPDGGSRSVKTIAILEPGDPVTLSVPDEDWNEVGHLFDSRTWNSAGNYRPQDIGHSVTFLPCESQQAQFVGGFAFRGEPCIELTVTIGNSDPYTALVPLGSIGCTQ